MRFVVFVATVAALGAAPPDKITKESITSDGQSRTYYLYVPPNAGATAPAPLIVMLHGSGRRGDVLLEAWKGLAKKEGVVLAGPDALNPQEWNVPQDGPQFLYDVVEAIRQSHRVDPRRVYVFGHSAGAVFGLYMGLLESRYFAAVAISAGAFRSPAEFTSIDMARRKIPLAVFVGTNDRFFPLAAVRATRDAFVAAGLPFELTEIKGHDHNYYARANEINRQAWKFLAPYALSEDPEFERHQFR